MRTKSLVYSLLEAGVALGISAQDPVVEDSVKLQNKKAFLFLALKYFRNES